MAPIRRCRLSLELSLLALLGCGTAASGPPRPSDGVRVDSPWIVGWRKPAANPILRADTAPTFVDPITGATVRWQRADVFNPGAVVRGDSVYLFFRAEDDPTAELGERTSRIGLAVSGDGIHFARRPRPVLYPDDDPYRRYEYPGGCEDPRVVRLPDGRYLMLYTAWNRDVARLSAATSTDLSTWTKHGPVFERTYDGRFHDVWSKSGSVVTRMMEDGTLEAARIAGKYWMYWGDAVVGLAHSDNLVDWTPVLQPDGALYDPLPRRPGHFDSGLTEPGPPALLTDHGILVLYNGRNATDSLRADEIPPGAYCGGQALFSSQDPTVLIARQDTPFICPDLPHEISGQYASGTTFIQGLVRFRGKWFLYYGTADSMVGVAVAEE